MNYEKLGKGRARIIDKGSELQVFIPTKKNFFIIVFTCAWLGGWAFGEVMVLTIGLPAVAKTNPAAIAFIIFWLIAWNVGGIVVISSVVWSLAGKEITTLSYGLLKIERKALNLGRTKQYSLSDVKNLRLAQSVSKSNFAWLFLWNMSGKIGTSLRFDYGLKTVTFARDIDEAEASYILGLFQQRGLGK